MSEVPEETVSLLDRLAKAGGIVGMSNSDWWCTLVEEYGEEMVIGFVVARRAEIRQPVSVAVVSNLCKKEAQRIQDKKDDAAEDAAMGRQVARTPAPTLNPGALLCPYCAQPHIRASSETTGCCAGERAEWRVANRSVIKTKAAPAAAESISDKATECRDDGVSTPAAGEATPEAKATAIKKPWGLTPLSAAMKTATTNQENNMATVKQLVKSVEDEIKRRGITAKAAHTEIGVAGTAIYAWRKGEMSGAAQEKITIWLPESAKKPAAGDESQAETVALERKPKRKVDATTSLGAMTLSSSMNSFVIKPVDGAAAGELLTQGANLADALRSLGASGYADVVTALVDRLRTVRAALSA